MIKNDRQLGTPFIDYTASKSAIEALVGLVGGETAYSTQGQWGYYNHVTGAWVWVTNAGGGGGTSVHNDLTGLQGGTGSQYYHLGQNEWTGLIGMGLTNLHKHYAQDITGIREVLVSNRTYYVRTDGNDSNTGLIDSAGGAFLTVQHAFDVIVETLDVAGFTVTIEIGNGVYAENITINNWVGNGSVIFDGNTSSPSSVVFAPPTGNVFTFTGVISGSLIMRGFRILPTSAQGFRGSHTGNVAGTALEFVAVSGQYSVWLDSPGGRFTFSGNNAQIGNGFGFGRSAYSTFLQIEGGGFTFVSGTTYAGAFLVGAGGNIRATPSYSGTMTGRPFAVNESYVEGVFALGSTQPIYDDASTWSQQTLPLYDVLTAQFDKTNATLANITGFSQTLLAGRTYTGRMVLYTASTVADGIKIDFNGGTATVTSFQADAYVMQGGALVAIGTSRSTALGTTIANVTAVTAGTIIVEFTIVVNGAGTFIPRFACNADAAGTSSVLINSFIEMKDRTQ